LLYGWGLVAGLALTFLFSPDWHAIDYPWKFGMAYPTTLAVFLLASCRKGLGYAAVTMGVMIGVINIAEGARSRGGVCLATAFYLVITAILRRLGGGTIRLKTKWILAAAASLVLGCAGIIPIYEYATSSGILGADAKDELEMQSSGQFGLLLGGRSAIFGSFPAIYDSPFIGHGSWARDPTYVLMQLALMAQVGYENADTADEDAKNDYLIPAHSYIFGAWVEAGIIGALFWGWVLLFTLRTLWLFYPARIVITPLASFGAFTLAWDLVFSPYGAEARLVTPYYVVMMMTCWQMAGHKMSNSAAGIAKKELILDLPSDHSAESNG
jgi:hypothetical protein